MKIAFLADSFLYDESTAINGTQVQMFNLAAAFAKRGQDVHYIALAREGRQREEAFGGFRIHWIPAGTVPFGWLREIGSFRQALETIDPDAVYQRGRSHLTYAAAKWARRRGKTFVWATNGEDSGERWKQIGRLGRSSRPLWKKAVLCPYFLAQDLSIHRGIRGVHRAVNQTEFQRRRLKANFGHDGIVLPSYFPSKTTPDGAAKEKIVLWMGSLSRNKQPDLFLEFARRGGDGWRFVLAGGSADTTLHTSLSRQAESLDNVQMVGRVAFNDTNDWFARARLVANTSRPEAEGLPNTFVQAWMGGTPVLSLHHDPNGWIAENGLGFCALGNLERFLAEGQAMLEDIEKLADMGARCARFAAEHFSAPSTIDAYLALFEADVGGRPKVDAE